MTNKFMRKRDKIRAQRKSRWYYSFWGAATIAVVAGQIYVGSGYRQMAKAFNRIIDTTMAIVEPRGYYSPLVPPPGIIYRDDMVVK